MRPSLRHHQHCHYDILSNWDKLEVFRSATIIVLKASLPPPETNATVLYALLTNIVLVLEFYCGYTILFALCVTVKGD
jgi:hypothetical protein